MCLTVLSIRQQYHTIHTVLGGWVLSLSKTADLEEQVWEATQYRSVEERGLSMGLRGKQTLNVNRGAQGMEWVTMLTACEQTRYWLTSVYWIWWQEFQWLVTLKRTIWGSCRNKTILCWLKNGNLQKKLNPTWNSKCWGDEKEWAVVKVWASSGKAPCWTRLASTDLLHLDPWIRCWY